MKVEELEYTQLMARIKPLMGKGRNESATFLNWFLENIYRLEDTEADDAICDAENDKGIDGIYVDHNEEEVHFLQAKLRQKWKSSVGDVGLKNLAGSLNQFDSVENVDAILAGSANEHLKNLVVRCELKNWIAKDYKIVGIYVTNESLNKAANDYLEMNQNIRVYDRNLISEMYVESDQGVGIEEEFIFDVGYVEPLSMEIEPAAQSNAKVFIFPASALQLVHLSGISDATLFQKNVRYELGNTAVNKSIKKSIDQKAQHKYFSLFHNGIILICQSAEKDGNSLKVKNYSVVNGAQSLTTFFRNKSKLSEDLRVLVRVIALNDDSLSRSITEKSNNQNAIKPRDLRSNHAIMTRLQNELNDSYDKYFFEIKRGEKTPVDKETISNDVIGRVILAFDLEEPWSSHQIYKVFDEKYAEIFGRPEVNAHRIVFFNDLNKIVQSKMEAIESRPMAGYALTRYFVHYVLAKILKENENSAAIVRQPTTMDSKEKLDAFFEGVASILDGMMIDLNFEVRSRGATFDYKAELKSPKQCDEIRTELLRLYAKDVARGKAYSFEPL